MTLDLDSSENPLGVSAYSCLLPRLIHLCIEELATDAVRTLRVFQGRSDRSQALSEAGSARKLSPATDLGVAPAFERGETGESLAGTPAVGFSEQRLRRLSLALWFYRLIPKESLHSSEDVGSFWRESLARAYAMQYLHHGDKDRCEIAFAMGLLSRFGKVLLARAIRAQRRLDDTTNGDCRAELNGADTFLAYPELEGDAGAAALRRWSFPEAVCRAAAARTETADLGEWEKSFRFADDVSRQVAYVLRASIRSKRRSRKARIPSDVFEYTLAAVERDTEFLESLAQIERN